MPRAYIEMIFRRTPGSGAGTWRSAADQTGPGGHAEPPARSGGIGYDRLLAITISPVARLFVGEMMVHLGVENLFHQGLLQIVELPVRVENRLRSVPAISWSRKRQTTMGEARFDAGKAKHSGASAQSTG